MSIWASWEAPCDDDHEDDCAVWKKTRWPDGGEVWEMEGRCNCGQPDAPLVYHGSHVLPSDDGERGGWVDIASLSKFVRHYRENPDSQEEPEGWEPFLRFGVNEGTVVLTERNVRMVYETLGRWLEGLESERIVNAVRQTKETRGE